MSYDRTQIDLTNCDREPIHIPGSIQPHGAMLVIDPDSNTVSYCSANIGDYLNQSPQEICGRELPDVIGSHVAHQINNAAARAGSGHIAGVVLRADPGEGRPPADITVHRYLDRLFVELEAPASPEDTEVALHLTQSLVRRIDRETDLDPLVRSVARLVRAMLGYDRVMVYRFLHNGAGRVVAEAKTPQLGSFLGQHFPVSDIPVQARKLYVQNWTRVIGDVNFSPVPLMPLIGDNEPAVDLSYAHLRSVSPIHCEYLRNIGVASSMSISIVVDGELWGLIACHHNSPKALSVPLRLSAELFAQYFSLHVASIEHRHSKLAAAATKIKLDAIVAGINDHDPVQVTLSRKLREFSSLLPCDGAAVWYGGEWASTGVVPHRHEVTS